MKLDHTKASTFIQCPRKYQLKFIKGIENRHGSNALRYGIAFHAAIEGYYSNIAKNGWTRDGQAIKEGVELAKKAWDRETEEKLYYDDYRTFENLVEAFIQFIDRFATDQDMLKVLKTERIFHIRIIPTEDELKKIPGAGIFYFVGRQDAEVLVNDRPWITEVKTTGRPLTIQQASLHRSPQLMGYSYAGKIVNPDTPPDGLLVLMHQLTSRKVKDGGYGKLTIDFSRIPQIFSREDLQEWRLAFIYTATEIARCMEAEFFPMRQANCYQFGACTYTGLCEQGRGTEDLVLDNYIVSDPWDVTTDKEAEHIFYTDQGEKEDA